jgi:hypothetical protein
MQLKPNERRRAARLPCRIPVRMRAGGRTLHAESENLSRVGTLLRVPLSELGLPVNASLARVARETTFLLGNLVSIELHYEIIGTLVRRTVRPVRIGRGHMGQDFVEVGCALRNPLTDAEVEFLGLPLPPLLNAEVAPRMQLGMNQLEPAEGLSDRRPLVDSPLSLVLCAAPELDAPPMAAPAEAVDRYGARGVLEDASQLPILPEGKDVSAVLTAMAEAYGCDPWVLLVREGQPIWSGSARLQAVEMGTEDNRIEVQVAFARSLSVPERRRLQLS